MKLFYNSLLALISLGFLGLIVGVALVAFTINYYSKDLPDYSQLKEYEPSIITRIYAGDGSLMAEYAQEKRVFVPIQKIPDIVKNAFISAEDQNFYEHNGVDVMAIGRAVVTNLRNAGTGRRLVGASTITQQVAKNFLLTNEVSYERKIKEAILAMRMERALTKDQLLELYLNEIFLGRRAYGVAAAALIYFNKSLDELEIEEAAYLAALPKAPNNYHPVRKHKAALERRNWVIDRMEEDGHITRAEAEIARTKPLVTKERLEIESVEADFFAEEVRRELKDKYGQDSLYQGGLVVRTSLDPDLQKIAVKALRDGLMAYDKRHGWRGPVANLKDMNDWANDLTKIATPEGMLPEWQMAVVLSLKKTSAQIGFEDGSKETLTLDGVRWARKCISDCYGLGPEVIRMDQVVEKGDVIMIEKMPKEDEEGEYWVLRQVPKVQGAIISLDPHTGRVLAMQGGWTQSASSFNRATQADRQPGSAFKPFVYLTALDNGFTPATLVLDAPFVIEQAPGDFWRPTNYSNKYYGPSTIRMGVEKSRNLMTVRLAHEVGMDKIVDTAEKFGIADEMKNYLSYSLGAGETTLLRLTSAYGMLVNGGKKITPTFIDRIQDRRGKTIFSYDKRPCANCGDLIRWDAQSAPTIPDTREQIADEKTAYQIVSILEGVIERGTGRRLKELGRPLAGKTGTTNESKDTWFIGFSPNLVTGVFVGFDDPKSLGKRETGSSVAAPIWGDFMKEALEDTPPTPFRVPPGLKNVRVNGKTGRLAQPGDEDVIWEVFVSGTEPNTDNYVLDTAVIGADNLIDPYGQDPYGYTQFGYEDFSSSGGQTIYNDGSVEVYGLPPEEGDESFNYFSNRQRQQQQQEQQQPPQMNKPQFGGPRQQPPAQYQQQAPNPRWERVPGNEEPRTAPAPAPQQDPNMSGTGGFY
jgi:penicillin-binding protein 1A